MSKGSALAARQRASAFAVGEAALPSLRIDLAELRLRCRLWANALADENRDTLALPFVRAALQAFARGAAPSLRFKDHDFKADGELDDLAADLARTIGCEAARLPLAEGLHFVSSLYPVLLPESKRSARGAYYTPPVLVDRLLDLATEQGVVWSTARVLDPAAGGGAFLVSAAMRMRAAMQGSRPAFVLRQICSRLSGFEIDPAAAWLAQTGLEIVLADLSASAGLRVLPMVRVCDTLNEPPQDMFDLVIGNPPYGRVALTPEQRRRYSRSLYGHANLYGVFTDAALRWTKPNGLIAYLTPTSFLAGQYFSALRKLLAGIAPPVSIDFVHARRGVFEDVLQETMLAVYRKAEGERRAQIHYLDLANEREVRITKNGTVGLPHDKASPWLAPRSAEHGGLVEAAEGMPSRLADWGYSVATGPLVWNRFKDQLCDRKGGRACYPLIWAECVTADGNFIFRADKKNHSPYFRIKSEDEWLVVTEPCVLVQRTTAKEQARRLIAAELPAEFVYRSGGVVVENHLNMVRANGPVKVSPAVVAAVLNSGVLDELFRCMNGSVAVSAFELEALPLPKPEDLRELKRLIGAKASRVTIEAECRRLYGVNP